MQIGGECIEYLLMNMVLEKEFKKDTNLKIDLSMHLHLGINKLQCGIVQCMTT